MYDKDKERIEEIRTELENIYRATEQISMAVTRLQDSLDAQ